MDQRYDISEAELSQFEMSKERERERDKEGVCSVTTVNP